VAELANDDSIALRVRFPQRLPAPESLYFRGPVLSDFDGREWTPAPLRRLELRPRRPELLGAPLRYEMTVEPSRLPLLPLLELTPDRRAAAPVIDDWRPDAARDGQWQLDRPLAERVRVQAQAWPRTGWARATPALGLRADVELPPGSNPRTLPGPPSCAAARAARRRHARPCWTPCWRTSATAATPTRSSPDPTAATPSTSSGSTASSASASTSRPPSSS
jgi:hypothetical protein